MWVRTEETSTMHRTLYGASRHNIIPSVLLGIADNRYSKASTNDRLLCTVDHVTFSFAPASPVLIIML